MGDHEVSARVGSLVKELKKLEQEKPTVPEEETDPRIVELLAEATTLIDQLDPIVRETFKDDPKTLAEWDDIMQGHYAAKEEEEAVKPKSP